MCQAARGSTRERASVFGGASTRRGPTREGQARVPERDVLGPVLGAQLVPPARWEVPGLARTPYTQLPTCACMYETMYRMSPAEEMALPVEPYTASTRVPG